MQWISRVVLGVALAAFAACTPASDAPGTSPGTPAASLQTLTVKGYKIANPDGFGSAVALPTIKDSAPVSKGVQKTEGSSKPDVGTSAPVEMGSGASSDAQSASSSPTSSAPSVLQASPLPASSPSKPSSVKFNDDGTFKVSYSDGSYLVGQWKKIDTQLQLTFGGDSALFDIKFPDAESIELWLKKATGQSSGGSVAASDPSIPIEEQGSATAGSVVQPGSSITTSAPSDAATTQTGNAGALVSEIPPGQSVADSKAMNTFLAKTKGTWCYASGDTNVSDDAIASFVQLGPDDIHVLLFSAGSDYQKAELSVVNPDAASFMMSYYHPLSTLWAKFSVDGDVMTIKYAAFKKTLLKRIAEGEVPCPSLPKAVSVKTP